MYNLVIANTLEQRKAHERDIQKLEDENERDFASNNYHCTQLESENKKLNEVLLRKDEELIQSRIENDELERKQQGKQETKIETIERTLQLQKEYDDASIQLNNLRQLLNQENFRRNEIAEELEESRRMGRQP